MGREEVSPPVGQRGSEVLYIGWINLENLLWEFFLHCIKQLDGLSLWPWGPRTGSSGKQESFSSWFMWLKCWRILLPSVWELQPGTGQLDGVSMLIVDILKYRSSPGTSILCFWGRCCSLLWTERGSSLLKSFLACLENSVTTNWGE